MASEIIETDRIGMWVAGEVANLPDGGVFLPIGRAVWNLGVSRAPDPGAMVEVKSSLRVDAAEATTGYLEYVDPRGSNGISYTPFADGRIHVRFRIPERADAEVEALLAGPCVLAVYPGEWEGTMGTYGVIQWVERADSVDPRGDAAEDDVAVQEQAAEVRTLGDGGFFGAMEMTMPGEDRAFKRAAVVFSELPVQAPEYRPGKWLFLFLDHRLWRVAKRNVDAGRMPTVTYVLAGRRLESVMRFDVPIEGNAAPGK